MRTRPKGTESGLGPILIGLPQTKEARQVELAGFLRGYSRGALGGDPRLPVILAERSVSPLDKEAWLRLAGDWIKLAENAAQRRAGWLGE